ncbi:MAG: hypothetical protein WC740_14620 [Verrucomicrobiia bacterium]
MKQYVAILMILTGTLCPGVFAQETPRQPKRSDKIEVAEFLDVNLFYDLYLFTLLLSSDNQDITDKGKQNIRIAFYDRVFVYWVWVYGPEPKLERMRVFEKNFRARGVALLNEMKGNMDPLCVKGFYENGKMPWGRKLLIPRFGVDEHLYEKWEDYQKLVSRFQKEFLGW